MNLTDWILCGLGIGFFIPSIVNRLTKKLLDDLEKDLQRLREKEEKNI